MSELRAANVAGIYLMPQFGRYDLAADVVEAARRRGSGRSGLMGNAALAEQGTLASRGPPGRMSLRGLDGDLRDPPAGCHAAGRRQRTRSRRRR